MKIAQHEIQEDRNNQKQVRMTTAINDDGTVHHALEECRIDVARYVWLYEKGKPEDLTEEELAAGWHYCYEWDGLLLRPQDPEYGYGACCRRLPFITLVRELSSCPSEFKDKDIKVQATIDSECVCLAISQDDDSLISLHGDAVRELAGYLHEIWLEWERTKSNKP